MNNKVKTITTLLVLAGLLVGCGSSGSSSKNTKAGYKGVFVDSFVSGISYSCGNVTGITDTNGVFGVCPAGSNVTFSIGNIELGTAGQTADNIFTPQDLVGIEREISDNNKINFNRKINLREKANLIASLLLSLDTDGDPSNGISITPEVITAFKVAVPTPIAMDDMTEATISAAVITTSDALPNINLVVVSVEEAAAHLVETAAAIDAGVIIAPEQPVILDDSTN